LTLQVGADVVEVSPGYDHAEVTAMAAADLVQEFLALMVKKGERIPAISRGVLAEPIPSDAAAAEHDEL
jgi:agmatinase